MTPFADKLQAGASKKRKASIALATPRSERRSEMKEMMDMYSRWRAA